MKLKKYISLSLSALLLMCVLAGCGPSVEHRFDTTEYSAQAEATMRSISRELARMDSLLAGHNADLDAAFARYEDGKPGRPGGDVADTAITQDDSLIRLNGADAKMLMDYKSFPSREQKEVREFVRFKKYLFTRENLS